MRTTQTRVGPIRMAADGSTNRPRPSDATMTCLARLLEIVTEIEGETAPKALKRAFRLEYGEAALQELKKLIGEDPNSDDEVGMGDLVNDPAVSVMSAQQRLAAIDRKDKETADWAMGRKK